MSSEVRAASSGEGPLAIRARNLGKTYHVYDQPQDRLKQMLWRGRRRFYREFHAVRGVDLDVLGGETVGIVGRNGSGKSTLLRMICGLLEPTCGEVQVRGHVAPLLTLGTGFNPDFTGRDNVLLNAAILGISDVDLRERFDSIVDFADIGDFLDQPVRSYSSGMYARLAFAVAIHANPDILVIDEVLAVGDEAFTRKCFARIEKIKAAGATILFVSHSSGRIVELCDRAVLIDAGERLLTADAKTVVSQYGRLAEAPARDAPRIRQEICEMDAAGSATGAVPRPRAPGAAPARLEDLGEFDPGLVSRSAVSYAQAGAVIEDVRLLDARGRRVNVLRPGGRYHYAFAVRFLEPARGVRFGMMIKLITGFELSGQASHPPGAGIEIREAGVTAHVSFPLHVLLLPGTYFGNAGVLGQVAGDERYLHRILDATLFRVDGKAAGRMTGRVDLSGSTEAEVRLVRCA